ncbi:acylneuraminate cytidylyltransferase family protein [Fluoribacter dumoffii]|uniref:N-acylneuraminate cytidylyltransferase n=1 Tax=Fluoribacter dumoffii TaxID=463 RepID=A0A377G5L8_9GAMM|nr:acylneuraminate cytidylyltransferase family protein [Fluoribacter dumoffii]KTC91645.1 CMP-N-acetlyneuraminic acid synthetase [Fluoribacter dumoffii NY 23]MCW8417264.1 acylneuraminate cytidylyltransferase family protein [Fluoribacter dumoffii]MCW8454895.1 acylneuraminate cytidylyltransferase family protein [Fluoribacter dumoffii]MCW8461028.1 acylneuraminate cytidylyltransferase family protein [Fluoribacter dumoffii]MCW8484469.1 acylneuraminate cytidylyltransferase family protein [Fluoribacte
MINHAFIFARGGSKGLPRKNIKLLAGKPLIEYSIDVARQTPAITHIFVSTDDAEIAAVANQAGATVIHRPKELATDTCPEWLAWRHAVDYVTAHYGAFDLFISLPPTSPLRAVQDVEGAVNLFNTSQADVCISVTPANRNPFFNMVKKTPQGYLELVNHSGTNYSRRQEVPQIFDVTTVVYVTRPEFIRSKSTLFEGEVIGIEVPKVRAIDIDDIYDFMLAEAIINSKETQAKC